MRVKIAIYFGWHAIRNGMFHLSTVIVIFLCVGAVFFVRSHYSSDGSESRLLICSTSHTRFFPVRHSFTYPLLYVFFPINNPAESAIFAVDKWRVFHIRSDDYLGSPPCGPSLMEKLRWHLEQHVLSNILLLIQGILTSKSMTATMLTMPRFLGYSFNPLTTYYVYDNELVAVILEVHNTFGEKHIYVVRHSTKSQSITRRFHVSPFNDRLGTYQFKTTSPDSGITIELTLVTPEAKPKLVATLKSKSGALVTDNVTVLRLCLKCGWWIFLTFPRILFEAWKLHYRKGLSVYMRPEPFHENGTVGRQSPSSIDLYGLEIVF